MDKDPIVINKKMNAVLIAWLSQIEVFLGQGRYDLAQSNLLELIILLETHDEHGDLIG